MSRARHSKSWLGTLIVAVAVVVMGLRGAAELRRSLSPANAAAAPSAATR
jgi:hypothetical protein